MVTFIYNNKQYTTNNLDFKLQKLGANINDINILNKDYGLINSNLKSYYYSNGKQFTGVFKSDTIPPQKSNLPWCKNWELKEGVPDISMFSDKLQKIFLESFGL